MPFRRVRFFTGLFALADDWKAAHDYHIERRKKHNTTMHSPGIVEGLEVTADDGLVSVTVGLGEAIAPNGQEISLERPTSVDIPFAAAGHKIFLVLRHKDTDVDWRQDVANTAYSGHARTEERAELNFEIDAEPADGAALVLARINLAGGATKIAKEPGVGENQIDTRGIPRAGSRGVSAGLEIEREVGSADSHQVGTSANYEPVTSWAAGKDEAALHLAYVYPAAGQQGEVSWTIGSARKATGDVHYQLLVRNHGGSPVKVRYRVYRLRSPRPFPT